MAEQNKATLKNYFQTGDRPSQAQYADLIDSQLNLAETGTQIMDGALSSSGLESSGDITSKANISASGTVHTPNLTISSLGDNAIPFVQAGSGGSIIGSGVFTFNAGTLSVQDITQVTTSNIKVQGNGHITASGNISASGAVIGLTGSFEKLEVTTSSFGKFESTLISSSNILTTDLTASRARFGDSTVTINGPVGNISASGTITASTASIGHFIPNIPSVATNNLGNILDFTFSGSALFTTLPDHVAQGFGIPFQRVEIAAGAISASSTLEGFDGHFHGKVGIGTGNTPPNPLSSPHLDVRGDISSSGDVFAGNTSAKGVVLTSPNGTKFRLQVDNSGNLSTSSI